MIGEATFTIGDSQITGTVTRYEESAGSWIAEVELHAVPEFRAGATLAWGERECFVAQLHSDTEQIEVTRGPDWHVPARWEPSRWREFMPGRTSYAMTLRGAR